MSFQHTGPLDPNTLPVAERSAWQNGYEAGMNNSPLRKAVRAVLATEEWEEFSEGDVLVLVQCILRELAT